MRREENAALPATKFMETDGLSVIPGGATESPYRIELARRRLANLIVISLEGSRGNNRVASD